MPQLEAKAAWSTIERNCQQLNRTFSVKWGATGVRQGPGSNERSMTVALSIRFGERPWVLASGAFYRFQTSVFSAPHLTYY